MLIKLMSEETLSSFAIRSLYVAGETDAEKICSRLFLQGRNEWKLFPYANSELSKIFNNAIQQKSVENIIAQHTLAALYQPVSGINLRSFETRRLSEMSNKDFGSMPHCFNSAEILSSYIRHCPLCFSEQVENHGFPWFKREWQIHKMSVCLKHGCLLVSRCGCGQNKKGHNASLSFSMLRGYCDYCRAPFAALDASEFDSTYAAWLRHLLNASLPTFSRGLRAFLIKESAFKLGLKRSAGDDEIAKFLTALYDPFLISHPYRRPEIGNGHYTAERNYTNRLIRAVSNHRYDSYIPHTCLFHPLFHAFPNFNDFLDYLEKICYRSEEETYFGNTETILELIE